MWIFSSSLKFNLTEKCIAQYVNYTHFARRTICPKKREAISNAWYYHHQYHPFCKKKIRSNLLPNYESELMHSDEEANPLQTISDNLPQWKSLHENSTNSATDRIVWFKIKWLKWCTSDDVKPLKGFPTDCVIGSLLKMPLLEVISKRKISQVAKLQKCAAVAGCNF